MNDLAVQVTLKSLFQHHNSKALIPHCSTFFMVQLLHLYMTTGKTIALTAWTFVNKVMSLIFNMLSRFVIAFLPVRKCLLIVWLHSPNPVIFGAQEYKVCWCFHCFPIYLSWSYGAKCHDLFFEYWLLSQTFHLPLSPSSRGFSVPLCFLSFRIICIFEVIDISPGNLNSSLWFVQPNIRHDALCVLLLFSHSVVSNSLRPHGLQPFTISSSLLKLVSIESVMPSNRLILRCPLLFLPSIVLSIRNFSNESALHIKWPKYWSFSFSISPSNEYLGLISFRNSLVCGLALTKSDDLVFLQSKGLKSLLQHHCSKAAILQCSAFFMVQLSHPYMTTGKT